MSPKQQAIKDDIVLGQEIAKQLRTKGATHSAGIVSRLCVYLKLFLEPQEQARPVNFTGNESERL